MNTTHRLALAALTIGLGLAASLSAQPPEGGRGPGRGGPDGHRGPGGPGGRGPSAGIVRAIDTDKDGTLSAAEIAASSAAIAALDTNADGALTMADRPARPADAPARPADGKGPRGGGKGGPGEGKGPRPDGDKGGKGDREGKGGPGGRAVDPVMLALDADNNRDLSSAEIANAPASLAAIDTNKDGTLTRDELRPLGPTGGGPRGRK